MTKVKRKITEIKRILKTKDVHMYSPAWNKVMNLLDDIKELVGVRKNRKRH